MLILCLVDSDASYTRRVIRGVAEYARTHSNIDVEIMAAHSSGQLPGEAATACNGVILATGFDYSAAVYARGLPAISLTNFHPQSGLSRVVTDDQTLGRQVAEHFLMRGYRHFAFVGRDVHFSMQRYNGFCKAVTDALGTRAKPQHLTAKSKSVGRQLNRLQKPLALMAANDPWARHVMNISHQSEWLIPDDVAVVGVDNDDVYGGDITRPPLSSVLQLTDRIGYAGVKNLIDLIEGRKVPQITLIPPGPLIVRESSQAVAVDDDLVIQAIQTMEQTLSQQINIKQLLGTLGVSRRAMELRFAHALGRTPGAELKRLRIERAKFLLATTSRPVSRIAEEVGFSNPPHLCHTFKALLGVTPSAYRNNIMPSK